MSIREDLGNWCSRFRGFRCCCSSRRRETTCWRHSVRRWGWIPWGTPGTLRVFTMKMKLRIDWGRYNNFLERRWIKWKENLTWRWDFSLMVLKTDLWRLKNINFSFRVLLGRHNSLHLPSQKKEQGFMSLQGLVISDLQVNLINLTRRVPLTHKR